MKNNCIISQVHIPDFDPQGSLYPEQKKRIVDLSIKHLRKNNSGLIHYIDRPWKLSIQEHHKSV